MVCSRPSEMFQALALSTLAVLAPCAEAQNIEWNGFFTAGAAFTDADVPYQTNTIKKIKFMHETLLGLNISKNLNEEWRFAGQILSRAAQADGAAKVDWAFATYKSKYGMDITLGKQKIPMWMISSFRDVGRAYPWVNPPEDLYSVFPLRSFTGVSIDYSLQLGTSTLAITPYGGEVITETAPSAPTPYSKIVGTNMAGVSLEWTWQNLQLRAAFNRALWNVNQGELLQFGERRYELSSCGLKYSAAGFLVMSEWGSTEDHSERTFEKRSDELIEMAAEATATGDAAAAKTLAARAATYRQRIGGARAYYVTLGQQWASFLAHVTYASLQRPYNDIGSRDQTSTALGINYDINTDSVIKVEAKRISLPEDSQGLFSAPMSDREAMVYRLAYSLIF